MQRLCIAVLLAMGTFLLLSCGSDEEGGSQAKGPLNLNEETVERGYDLASSSSPASAMSAKRIGTKTIGGRDFPIYKAGKHDGINNDGVESWIDWSPDGAVIAGGQITWDGSGLTPPGTPIVLGEFDPPLEIDVNVLVGIPQTIHATGHAVMGDPASPILEIDIDHDVIYTKTEEDITIQTPMGPVEGCSRFTGSTVVEGVDYNGEIVFHPTVGLVEGWANWPPPNGSGIDINGIRDLGGAASGYNEMQAVALVGPGNPNFDLDTYDVNGTLDADKNTHAKMFLEVRFADEAMAMTDTEPAVGIDFGTAWGTFGGFFVQSPISFFHPEENGKGYTYWIAFVDQAAKNEPVNGIAYHISVNSPDYNSQDVRVSARIIYKLYTP